MGFKSNIPVPACTDPTCFVTTCIVLPLLLFRLVAALYLHLGSVVVYTVRALGYLACRPALHSHGNPEKEVTE